MSRRPPPAAVRSPARCPCCGQALAGSALLVDLNSNTVSCGGREVRVQRRVAELLSILVRMMPVAVHKQRLIALMFSLGEPHRPEAYVRNYACYARAAVRQLGFDVVVERGAGYRIVAEGDF